MEKIEITLNINGKPHELMIYPNETLLDVLRDRLDLTGSKESCGEGVCGSCTIHMDGKPVRKALAGNICRCTGYAKIVTAVAHAAQPQDHCCDCKSKA